LPTPPLPKARVEALTDGIFAVTLTLLVLDVHFPAPADAPPGAALLALVDLLDNYVISFAVLAVFWIGHLRLMRRLAEPDGAFLAWNLAFLFLTTLVPPLTTLLGNHPDMPRAALLYGANLFLLLGCELAMWRRVCHRLPDAGFTDAPAVWPRLRRRYGVAMAVVLAAIVLALLEIELRASRGVAAWLYLLLLGMGTVQPRMAPPRAGRRRSR
jgi:uncharacterized membrane protein